MMNTDRSLMAELIEMEAWADMMAAMPEPIRQAMMAESSVVGGALAISAKTIPLAQFNRAMGLGLEQAAQASQIGTLARHLREKSIPAAQVQVAPFAKPAGIDALLKAAGFSLSPVRWAKLGRPTANPPRPATALVVEPVRPETAADFARAVWQGFGMPPFFAPWLEALALRDRWRCYVARHDGAVVAGSAMYLGAHDAWLGVTATVPDARRNGAQGALMARRFADAAKLGKGWAFTETGILEGDNPSLRNMHRSGFEVLHERSNWVLDR